MPSTPLSPALLLPLALLALLAPAHSAHADEPPCEVDHGLDFEDASAQIDWGRIGDFDSESRGGVAWVDYDDDGDLDLYVINSPGGDNALYRNDGGTFTDVAPAAGVAGDATGYTGVVAGDLDNDGCTDLFLTGAGSSLGLGLPNRLYLNNCDGTFDDVTTQSGIDPVHPGLMAALGDIDADGYLDLFVTS
ncbi:MAG: VCBS repeat-containing protein, partial [Nannocystaceae bacterium]